MKRSDTLETLRDDLRLIDVVELSRITVLSKATLWRHHDAGLIPNGCRIGRSVRWRLRDIRQWLDLGCPPVTELPARATVSEGRHDD